MAHITGGGLLENIPRVLPESLAAQVDLASWQLPAIFGWLAKTGRLDTRELARTFNCGIGMVLIVGEAQAAAVLESLAAAGEVAFPIGTLAPRAAEPVVLINKQVWGLGD
jgi:phosphoribosylaminoimidazole (AIR) synthetase